MKKIVALVLSLVMVLGLATVAFADVTTTTLKAADGYAVYAVDATTPVATNTNITKTVSGNAVAPDGTVTYYATEYVMGTNYYVEVDSACATHKLVKGTAIVAYLAEGADVSTSVVADKAVAGTAPLTPECGEYAVDVIVIKGVAYEAGGVNWAVLNNKFVNYGAVVTAEPHDYAVATYTVLGQVATLKCDECPETWKVLSANDVKTMAPSAYAQATVGATSYYIAVASVPAVDGEKVESAETFDAGIAMYVGMSVMAAAGSAVVLKKKD